MLWTGSRHGCFARFKKKTCPPIYTVPSNLHRRLVVPNTRSARCRPGGALGAPGCLRLQGVHGETVLEGVNEAHNGALRVGRRQNAFDAYRVAKGMGDRRNGPLLVKIGNGGLNREAQAEAWVPSYDASVDGIPVRMALNWLQLSGKKAYPIPAPRGGVGNFFQPDVEKVSQGPGEEPTLRYGGEGGGQSQVVEGENDQRLMELSVVGFDCALVVVLDIPI